jgi:hypothetical protein
MSEKSGFIYIWRDRKHRRYYIGSHWGTEDDGYICSSGWMNRAYKLRPLDFKRRIIVRIDKRANLLDEERRWLSMIKPSEIKRRYYNLKRGESSLWHHNPNSALTVGQKISKAKKGQPRVIHDRAALGANISATKKRKFQERRDTLGYAFTPEHAAKLAGINIGRRHTEEWKAQNSENLKQQWATGVRKGVKRVEPGPPGRKRGERIKELWADPIWAAAQREKLREGSARRYNH